MQVSFRLSDPVAAEIDQKVASTDRFSPYRISLIKPQESQTKSKSERNSSTLGLRTVKKDPRLVLERQLQLLIKKQVLNVHGNKAKIGSDDAVIKLNNHDETISKSSLPKVRDTQTLTNDKESSPSRFKNSSSARIFSEGNEVSSLIVGKGNLSNLLDSRNKRVNKMSLSSSAKQATQTLSTEPNVLLYESELRKSSSPG